MQTNNNQPIYATLENHVPTPTTDSHYAIVEPASVVYSDDQSSSTKPRTSKSRKNKISKRKQVKNACINCQKACKKCDEGRACQRCIKLGIADTCVDSPRKERLKGVKRGPYKKRQRQNDEFNQMIANGQELPIKYEQPMIWDNTTPTIHRQQKQQQSQPQIQIQYQQPQHHQRQVSTSSSSDLMLGHEQLSTGYYSPPICQQYQYQQPSLHGTPSPLMNSFGDYHQYNNSPVASSLSTSPASSTVLLPQDTLQSILTLDDMIPLNMNSVPLNQDILYTGDYSMMMPLQSPQHDSPLSPATSSFAWSNCTPSPTTTNFACQSQPAQCQPYQLPLDQVQVKQEQILYWEPSSISAYDLPLSYASTQPYM